jgi:hypothetical protein
MFKERESIELDEETKSMNAFDDSSENEDVDNVEEVMSELGINEDTKEPEPVVVQPKVKELQTFTPREKRESDSDLTKEEMDSLMSVKPQTLAADQYNALKKHVVKILLDTANLVDSDSLELVAAKLDDLQSSNANLDFGYNDDTKGWGLGKIIVMMLELNKIVNVDE